MRLYAVKAGFFSGVFLACAGHTSPNQCEAHCPAGLVCVEGHCAEPCAEDGDCASGCCTEASVCGAACPVAVPEILLDRNAGSALAGTGHLPGNALRGQHSFAVSNQADACGAEFTLRGEIGPIGEPGSEYLIGEESGLILEEDTMSVDAELILNTFKAAFPTASLTLNAANFIPTSNSSWANNGMSMYHNAFGGESKATARLHLPDGARLAAVRCWGASNTGAQSPEAEVSVALSYGQGTNNINQCPGGSLSFPFGTAVNYATVDIPVDNLCKEAVNNDAVSAEYRVYFLTVTGNTGNYDPMTALGLWDNHFRRCHVQYTPY